MKQGVAISQVGHAAHLINKWLPVSPRACCVGERSSLEPGKEGRRVARFGMMFGGYQLFVVWGTSLHAAKCTCFREGCEDGGVRVVFVKNMRRHP